MRLVTIALQESSQGEMQVCLVGDKNAYVSTAAETRAMNQLVIDLSEKIESYGWGKVHDDIQDLQAHLKPR